MYLEDMPGCCGIKVIECFDEAPEPPWRDPTKADIRAALTKYTNLDTKIDDSPWARQDEHSFIKGYAMLVATLNGAQVKKGYEKILVDEFGFTKTVDRAYHPFHRSKISMYTKVLHPEQSGPAKRKPKAKGKRFG